MYDHATQEVPVFVDGKECGRSLTQVDLEAKKKRNDLATYECGLGHRSYFLLEPKPKARPSDITREDRATNGWADAEVYRNSRPEIREEIYRLGRQLEEMDKGVKG